MIRLTSLVVLSLMPAIVQAELYRLRNDTTPGVVTTYSITVSGTLEVGKVAPIEKYEWQQNFSLTRIALEPLGKQALRRGYITLSEKAIPSPRLVEGKMVSSLPPRDILPLLPRATRINVDLASIDDDPIHVEGDTLIADVLRLGLDVAHWSPGKKIETRDTWEKMISPDKGNGFRGTRRYTFSRTEGVRPNLLGVINIETDGNWVGTADKSCILKNCESTVFWHIPRRILKRLESQLELEFGPESERSTLIVTIKSTLLKRERLSADNRKQAVSQLDSISTAMSLYRADKIKEAAVILEQMLEQDKDSIWKPAIEDLLANFRARENGKGNLTREKLESSLIHLMIQWQKISPDDESSNRQHLRKAFKEIAASHENRLFELADDPDPSIRAIALFTLGFSSSKESFERLVLGCSDSHQRVRAWSFSGLSEKADPKTRSDLLLRGIQDNALRVRYRAAMAVRTCLKKKDDRRADIITKLMSMTEYDIDNTVRLEAALALQAICTVDDLESLYELRDRLEDPEISGVIKDTIKRITPQN